MRGTKKAASALTIRVKRKRFERIEYLICVCARAHGQEQMRENVRTMSEKEGDNRVTGG